MSNRFGSYRESVFSAGFVGGAIIVTDNATVTISQSNFEDNGAEFGGAIFADNYSIINLIDDVSFINNFAENFGGVLYSNTLSGVVTINTSCTFSNNKAVYGVLYAFTSTLTIEASEFHDNVASKVGVLDLFNSSITIGTNEFHDNSANTTGILYLFCCNITIKASEFYDNVISQGSVLASILSNMVIEGSVFYSNHASNIGGVLYSGSSTITFG